MEEYFASAVIISHVTPVPAIKKLNMQTADLMEENDLLIADQVYICMKVAARHLTYFNFLDDFLPVYISSPQLAKN